MPEKTPSLRPTKEKPKKASVSSSVKESCRECLKYMIFEPHRRRVKGETADQKNKLSFERIECSKPFLKKTSSQ